MAVQDIKSNTNENWVTTSKAKDAKSLDDKMTEIFIENIPVINRRPLPLPLAGKYFTENQLKSSYGNSTIAQNGGHKTTQTVTIQVEKIKYSDNAIDIQKNTKNRVDITANAGYKASYDDKINNDGKVSQDVKVNTYTKVSTDVTNAMASLDDKTNTETRVDDKTNTEARVDDKTNAKPIINVKTNTDIKDILGVKVEKNHDSFKKREAHDEPLKVFSTPHNVKSFDNNIQSFEQSKPHQPVLNNFMNKMSSEKFQQNKTGEIKSMHYVFQHGDGKHSVIIQTNGTGETRTISVQPSNAYVSQHLRTEMSLHPMTGTITFDDVSDTHHSGLSEARFKEADDESQQQREHHQSDDEEAEV